MEWLWATSGSLFSAAGQPVNSFVDHGRVPQVVAVAVGRDQGPRSCPCWPAPVTHRVAREDRNASEKRPATTRLLLVRPISCIRAEGLAAHVEGGLRPPPVSRHVYNRDNAICRRIRWRGLCTAARIRRLTQKEGPSAISSC